MYLGLRCVVEPEHSCRKISGKLIPWLLNIQSKVISETLNTTLDYIMPKSTFELTFYIKIIKYVSSQHHLFFFIVIWGQTCGPHHLWATRNLHKATVTTNSKTSEVYFHLPLLKNYYRYLRKRERHWELPESLKRVWFGREIRFHIS